MRREAGFTLIELMIVIATIAIIAAVAMPILRSAKKASNEASATGSLRTVTTANNQYRIRFQLYASSLSSLTASGYIDGVLGGGTKSGYAFTYNGGANTWTCSALPTNATVTGDRGFFVDESGVIRFELTGAASATSPPLD